MFSIRRKIGTGATSRRRLSRQCKPEVDGMETRALLSILVSAPGSPIVESGTPTNLNVSLDEHGHGSASLTNPATGALLANPVQLQSNLIGGTTLVPVPGVTGPGTNNPLTLAYKLPTAVNPGDAAVYDSQTGRLSDVLRFTDTVSITTNTVQGWVLVYSDFTTANPADSPADTFNGDTLAGLPPDFNQFSGFNGTAYEFGVEGFNVAEYVANQTAGQGPEQAFYSFQSDGNFIPSTGG